jgi:competence protein ComEC
MTTYLRSLRLPISFFLAFSFILGILANTSFLLAFLAVIPLVYGCYRLFAQHVACQVFISLIVLAFFAGYWRYSSVEQYATTHMELACLARPVRIEGAITDITSTHVFISDAHHSTRDEKHIPIPYYLQCSISGTNTLLPGDTIAIDFPYICPIHSKSFQRYLVKSGITATLRTNINRVTIKHRPNWSMRRWIYVYKNQLLKNSVHNLSPHAAELFQSLFFGKKDLKSTDFEETKEQFKKWGISHLLARSGLHLLIFLLLWQYVLSFLPIHIQFKSLLLVLLVLLYAIISINAISFVRSLLLFILHQCCAITGLPHQSMHLIAITCLIMLFFNPFYLFFLDFQLSFCFATGLIWLFHHNLLLETQNS